MGVAIYLGLVGGGLVAAFVASTVLRGIRLI
jgi:3-dehydroquinate synthetase